MSITLNNLLLPFNLLASAFFLQILNGKKGPPAFPHACVAFHITSELKALGTRLGFYSALSKKKQQQKKHTKQKNNNNNNKKPGGSKEDLVINVLLFCFVVSSNEQVIKRKWLLRLVPL